MNINVRGLISSHYSEPNFFVNFYKITRPSSGTTDDLTHKIQKTNKLRCWKIHEEKLVKLEANNGGMLFDCESYIIQWLFDLKVDNTLIEELLVYYWKGQNALKGYSPLPPEIAEHCPVERIVQWSEPAIFFYSFPKRIFTFTGFECAFDNSAPHLLLARGELCEELHFYEVPCEKRSLRSKASFLLVVPEGQLFYYWHGVASPVEHRHNIVGIARPHDILQLWQKKWANFSVQEIQESRETEVFLNVVKGNVLDYYPLEMRVEFSPKLFYLNWTTGNFLVTEVEYPLRAKDVVATFPFLQSHLYTAEQPALFLVDNHTKIWLWQGPTNDPTSDIKKFEEKLAMAQELLSSFIKEKQKLLAEKVTSHHVYAYKEPLEFKNIFPFWN